MSVVCYLEGNNTFILSKNTNTWFVFVCLMLCCGLKLVLGVQKDINMNRCIVVQWKMGGGMFLCS